MQSYIYIYIYKMYTFLNSLFHHHHWPNSPWWALAFLRSFAHSSPFEGDFLPILDP